MVISSTVTKDVAWPEDRLGELSPLRPQALENPYPAYAKLRRHAPLYALSPGRWIVTRHADVHALLNDDCCMHWGEDTSAHTRTTHEAALAEVMRLFSPSHAGVHGTPLRRRMATAMSSIDFIALEKVLSQLARERLDALASTDGSIQFDAIADYALPLTAHAACRVLGLDSERSRQLSGLIVGLRGSLFQGLSVPGSRSHADPSASQLVAYLQQLIRSAATLTEESLLRQCIDGLGGDTSEQNGSRLINLALVIIYASHHNMMLFIGNGLLALAESPTVCRRLRREPDSLDKALLELLRFDNPLQYIVLIVRAPFALHGRTLSVGDEVLACIGSANRDSEVFEDPDVLNIDRVTRASLSFGDGPWRCIGSRIAHCIAGPAFRVILQHGSALRLGSAPRQWITSPFVQRGLCALPMRIDA